MTQAKINPVILRWARERLQWTEEEAARKIGLKDKPERLQAWEKGDELPTFRQAQDLARALHIPFGYLFLSKPPLTTLPPEIGRLTALQTLGISHNRITALPPEIGNLTALQRLYLVH